MRLTLDSLQHDEAWKGYRLPGYDVMAMREKTKEKPTWIHFGAGNIFRAFPAVMAQRLLQSGDMDTGIITCESYDEEIVRDCFHPVDNLTVAVTMLPSGAVEKEVVASVAETLTMAEDKARVEEIFCSPSLQMATFTITEKGYAIRTPEGEWLPAIQHDMQCEPEQCVSFLGQLTALCFLRLRRCGTPLALSSLDNCAPNGEKLAAAVKTIAAAWREKGFVSEEDCICLEKKITFPVSMIDKITPRPAPRIAELLEADGLENMQPIITSKHTYIAPFVNAERPQYLVIEDKFPNGHPPLDRVGVIYADRDTVDKVEQMKVCTCLNPPQTALAVLGCLLGYRSIADEMKDPDLSRLVRRLCMDEGMPVVVNSGVISADDFVKEVLEERLPNPYMPDTPQRIATDTSQKVAIRFGRTVTRYQKEGAAQSLRIIPLVLAAWLRYLIGVDDSGKPFACSPDPLLKELQEQLSCYHVGEEITSIENLEELLADTTIFGCDLYACGLANTVIAIWKEMMRTTGAVRSVLREHMNRYQTTNAA